jgi:hypothetical protein
MPKERRPFGTDGIHNRANITHPLFERRRVGYAIELDPGYVDTAVERWQRMTGQSAIHANGKTFDEMRSERLASVEEDADQ